MKKYFMKSSSEELQFVDIIELDFTKNTKNGPTHHHHLECKFLPDLVPLLLEQGIIIEKEFPDESPTPSDNENYELAEAILSTIETLTLKLQQLETKVNTLNKTVKKLQHNVSKSSRE